jgi:TPR repeat protein
MALCLRKWMAGRLPAAALVAALAGVAAPLPASADFLSGVVAYQARDYERARQEFLAPDTVHIPLAKAYLGRLFLLGRGGERDRAAGRRFLDEAVAVDLPEAIVFLAQVLEQGHFLPKDTETAVVLWRRGAELGIATAQNALARRFLEGDGVAQDYAEGRRWLLAAAAQNDASAMTSLGYLAEQGLGEPADAAKAETYYREAVLRGHPTALNNLAWLLAGQNRSLKEAETFARRAVDDLPTATTMDTLGFVLLQQGRAAEALIHLDRAALLSPESWQVQEHLGDAHWQLGNVRAARAAWGKAQKLAEDAGDAQRLEGKIAGELSGDLY